MNMNESEKGIGILPLEVISYILEFLPFNDRICARSVSHLWYEASIASKIIKKEKVVLRQKLSLDDNNPYVLAYEKSCRTFYHFDLIACEIGSKLKRFWASIGPSIRSLSVKDCDTNEQILIAILSKCTCLESLEIVNCRDLMYSLLFNNADDIFRLSNVNSLTDLCLKSNRYLSDDLFNKFMLLSHNISKLSLSECQISFNPGLYKKFYPDSLNGPHQEFSSVVLTFQKVLKILQSRAKLMKSLNLSGTLVDSKSLSQIAQVPGLSLEELYLRGCEQLTNSGIVTLTQYQSNLCVLDLASCSRVTDQSLISICATLKQLKRLHLASCRAVTDIGVSQLDKLDTLQELDLTMCHQVSHCGLETGLCKQVNVTLKKLQLMCLNNITGLATESLPNLTHLNLSYCNVTDQSLQAIFRNQPWLLSLKLAGCTQVSDAGLTCVVLPDSILTSSHKHEHHISLRTKDEEVVWDSIRKKAVLDVCEARLRGDGPDRAINYTLASLHGLQELDLSECTRVTDVSLKYALKSRDLQYLNLNGCHQVTNVGLADISANLPSIDHLHLNRCINVTDEAILGLTRSLKRLKCLSLNSCTELTDLSLESVKANCSRLSFLNMSQCSSMSSTIRQEVLMNYSRCPMSQGDINASSFFPA